MEEDEEEEDTESHAHESSVAPALNTSATAGKSASEAEGHGIDDSAAEAAASIKAAEAPTYDGPSNGFPADKKSGPSGEGSSGVRALS